MSEKQNGPVRLAIIGSGLAVKDLHWPALKKLEGKYQIVMTCDVDPAAAQEIADMAKRELNSPECRSTTDYREVLANEGVEAVLLSLPIHLTAQFMLDAARAGKHILAEKPLAANLPQAQELAATLHNFNHLVIEIAENYHYREDFFKAKEWLAAGRIGELFLIEIRSRFWTNTASGFASTPWRMDNQYRGGLVADAGVHYAAALRELGGEVEQLQAFSKLLHPQLGSQDTLLLNLRFRNGALGSLTFTGAAKTTENTSMQTLLCGTEGSIRLNNGKVILTEGANQEARVVEEWSVPDFDNGYRGEFENFYQAIRHGAPVVATVEEALRDWEIIMYALDSAETRSVILL